MKNAKLHQWRFLLTACVALTATSCGGPEALPDACDTFPAEMVEALNTDVEVEETEKSEAIETAVARIEECYPGKAYFRKGHPLVFERASLGTDGKIYIFYNFTGVTDDMIVFRFQSGGEADAVFGYSPLSRFAVPD